MATSLSGLLSTGLAVNGVGATNSNGTNTFAGLGQGINVTQFVQLAEANSQAQITNLQNEQSGVTSQISAVNSITSALSALQNDITALNDPLGVLASQAVTSSNPGAVSGTASFSATPGTHTINVTSLATTSSLYSDPVATSSTPLQTGDTITISQGNTPVATVTLSSSVNTLSQIASAINNQTSAVQASVINDANGARLAILSSQSGSPGNLTITGNLHTTGSNPNTIAFHQVQGLNAALTVDGVPVNPSSNTLNGVIPGLTLNLSAPTGGTPITLTVAQDTASIASEINQFVNDYNAAINAINAQFAVNSDGSGVQPLESDGSLRAAQQELLTAVTTAVGAPNNPVNLATFGITLNNDGTLSVNSAALSNAISSNFSGLQSFLQTAKTGFLATFGGILNSLVGPGGLLPSDLQGYQSSSNDLTQQIADLQAALAVQTQNLTATYAQVNTTLQELPLLQAQLAQQLATLP